jgi:hypothetical protein
VADVADVAEETGEEGADEEVLGESEACGCIELV